MENLKVKVIGEVELEETGSTIPLVNIPMMPSKVSIASFGRLLKAKRYSPVTTVFSRCFTSQPWTSLKGLGPDPFTAHDLLRGSVGIDHRKMAAEKFGFS